MNTRALLFIIVSFFTIAASAAVFGRDDRRAADPASPQARATAVAVLVANRTVKDDGTVELSTDPASGFLCADQKFASERSLSYACTAFLIAPDLLVSAGHCLVNTGEIRDREDGYCEAYEWLFDYHGRTEGIPTERLYRCRKIVYAVNEQHPPYRDFGIVRLDRAVTDRSPVTLASSPTKAGDEVTMLGFPLGLPMKIADRARVLKDDPSQNAIVTNLDAFEGNSGSPVFNSRNEVVGILVRGTPQNSLIERGRCSVYNRCDDEGSKCTRADANTTILPGFQRTGSDVQRIAPIRDILRETTGG